MLHLLRRITLEVPQEFLYRGVWSLSLLPSWEVNTYVVEIIMLPVEEHMSLRSGRERQTQPCRIHALLLQVALRALKDLVEVGLNSLHEIVPVLEERIEGRAYEHPVNGRRERLQRCVAL